MITYCTCSGATPAFARAPRIATAPRSEPLNPASEPWRRPIGVRAPATITDDADCWLGTVCLPAVGEARRRWARTPSLTSVVGSTHERSRRRDVRGHRPRRGGGGRPRRGHRLLPRHPRHATGARGGQRGAGRPGGDDGRRRLRLLRAAAGAAVARVHDREVP